MKKIILILIFGLLLNSSAFSELKSNVFVKIRLENGVNNPWEGLIFGLAKNATDSMDSEYGEQEIPNFPFPAGVFTAVFLTYSPKDDQEIWSYTSIFGPHPDSISFFKKYKFKVFYGGSNYVTMKWGTLPKYLDSAIISDPFGGKFFRVNMKQETQKTNTEILVDEFEIYAHFTVDPNSIFFTELDNNQFNIYPNPSEDYILFDEYEKIKDITIYNSTGNVVTTIENYDGSLIDIRNLASGLYLIKINNLEGNLFVKKLLINK